jgi:hypothetical protein
MVSISSIIVMAVACVLSMCASCAAQFCPPGMEKVCGFSSAGTWASFGSACSLFLIGVILGARNILGF